MGMAGRLWREVGAFLGGSIGSRRILGCPAGIGSGLCRLVSKMGGRSCLLPEIKTESR
jgi:hypothetical protein